MLSQQPFKNVHVLPQNRSPQPGPPVTEGGPQLVVRDHLSETAIETGQ